MVAALTLTRVLAVRITIKSLRGSERSLTVRAALLLPILRKRSISRSESEKKAVSEPETTADMNKSMTKKISCKICSDSKSNYTSVESNGYLPR